LNVYKNANAIDWQKEIFGQTGIAQTHNIGLSGGSKKLLIILVIRIQTIKPL
jgi:hypothetical protein